MKKIKEKFGEEDKEAKEEEGEYEEEEEKGQALLEITQGLGEDKDVDAEGAEGEEVEEAPTPTDRKKRKTKIPSVIEPKKVAKPSHPKPTTPTTRASTRVIAQNAKVVTKPKEKEGGLHKRPSRKYVS